MKELFFKGFPRKSGNPGIRNHVLILPASMCASDVARIVSNQVKGTVTFSNQLGCAQVPGDEQYTMDVMAGYAANPNIYGTIVISLGCENCQMDKVVKAISALTDKPLKKLIIQEEGGTIKTVEKATRLALNMVQEASLMERKSFPLSQLIVGTECGGSDPTSGLAANVLVGKVSDFMVEQGGTVILSETTEFIGAEHILAERAKNEDIKKQIFHIVERYENALALVHEFVREGNPAPGNKAGGITTLEEKSLGCIHKGGSTAINQVVDYAKQITEKGLTIMDTPGADLPSVAGMVAGGAQIVLFTSGRGTPTGHPIAPVIKITGNRNTFKKMKDNIDIDASPIIYEQDSLERVTAKTVKELVQVASGKMSKAEVLGINETSIMRLCNFV